MFVEDHDWDDSLPMPSGDNKDNKDNKENENDSLIDLDTNNSSLSDSFDLEPISLADSLPLNKDRISQRLRRPLPPEEKKPDFSSIFDDHEDNTGVSDTEVSLKSNIDSSLKLEGGIDLNNGEINTWSVDLDMDYAKDDELEDNTVLFDDESIHNSDSESENIKSVDDSLEDSLYDYYYCSDKSLKSDELTSYFNPKNTVVVAQYEKPIDKYDIIIVASTMFTSFILLSILLLTLDLLVSINCPPGKNCHRPLLEAVKQTLGW